MPSPDSLLTLVINLDRSPHRLAQIAKQLQQFNWAWERLPAADGKNLSLQDTQLIDTHSFHRKHGMQPLPSELGCYLSHVWAMQRFLETDKAFLLILEDDIQLGPDIPDVIHGLMKQNHLWDVVMLSGVHRPMPLKVASVMPSYSLAIPLVKYAGSSCYLLHRSAAQAYLKDLLPMSLPYDHEYDRAWARGLKVRIVHPAPCQHSSEMGSDISPQGAAVQRKFHWSRRLPTYAWRIQNDLSRILYGLGQWWKYRT
jgi:glycosyl transferase family 25